MEDYVALVRRAPAPEVRDGRGAGVRLQTRVDTLALAALVQAMVRSSASTSRPAARSASTPQMLDENKWLAARHGLTASSWTCPPASAWPQGARASPARPPARARSDPARPPASRRSTICWRAATAPSVRWSSTRPTTTYARSWPRSWWRRRRRPGLRPTSGEALGELVAQAEHEAVQRLGSRRRWSRSRRCRR